MSSYYLPVVWLAALAGSMPSPGLSGFPWGHSTVLRPEAKAPDGASKPVDPSFPSFAIQGSSAASYTGNITHPNTFSANLIAAVEERTGGPLVVRIGGTNTDYSNFNPAQTIPVDPPQQGAGIGQKFVFGPVFYEGIPNFKNTRWIYDVPFAKENMTDSYYEAKYAVQNIGLDNLEALELGNEVDLYVKQGSRPTGYGPADYVAEFHNYSDWLVGALDLPDGPLFEVLTLSIQGGMGGNWPVHAIFDAGITVGGRVKSVSVHHYEHTNTTTSLQETLMNHTFVKDGLSSYVPDINFVLENYPEIEFNFGESGRYTSAQNSLDNTEGIFGAALWTVDYLLYLMSLSVHRVNMQLGQIFGYVAWHPIFFDGISPEVRSPYYGHLFAAEFMGGSADFRVSEISQDDDLVAAYAGYDHGELKRVAVVNYDVWESSSGERRPTRSFTIKVPLTTLFAKVQTLTSADGTSAYSDFYWSGKTWTYETNGNEARVPGQQEYKIVPALLGEIKVEVGASEAVLVHLEGL